MLDVTSLLEYINSKDDRPFSLLLEAIRMALRPYPTGEVTMYIGESTDFLAFDASSTLIIECENFKRIPFVFKFKRADIACCSEDIAWTAADEAYRWFFYRHTLPVDDHIILGED